MKVCKNVHSFVKMLKATDYYQFNNHLNCDFQICFGSDYFRWHDIRYDLCWSITYDDFMRLAEVICSETEFGVSFYVE